MTDEEVRAIANAVGIHLQDALGKELGELKVGLAVTAEKLQALSDRPPRSAICPLSDRLVEVEIKVAALIVDQVKFKYVLGLGKNALATIGAVVLAGTLLVLGTLWQQIAKALGWGP